jgi:DNA-binding response OmpR family regulator
LPTILIVEDDPGIAHLMSMLLRLEGYEVQQAKDWDEMLIAVEQIRPDLAIMDVHLRAGEGFDLLRQLRAHPDPYLARTPVLMMSGMDYRFLCKQAGADGFLAKPFDRVMLLEAIRKIQDRKEEEIDRSAAGQ